MPTTPVALRPKHRDSCVWRSGVGVKRSSSRAACLLLALTGCAAAPEIVRLEAGGLVARLSGHGAEIALEGEALVLVAASLGRGETLEPLPAGVPSRSGAEVRTPRGQDVTEWWRQTPGGLEHGLTVARRPSGTGELVATLDVAGLVPRAGTARSLELLDAGGRRVATYSALVAYDASGVELPARMEVRGATVALVVDDEGARYPIVIDPLLVAVQEASLEAPAAITGDQLGAAVALSGDGLRAIVGAPQATSTTTGPSTGSTRIFRRSGTTWTLEATLWGMDAGDGFGVSVALDATGTRAIVGAYGADVSGFNDGNARVFVRSGTAWTEEAVLVAAGGLDDDYLGAAVALSGAGDRAIVGAYGDDTAAGIDAGSATVFLRAGSVWTREATLLVAGAGPGDGAGGSVGMSRDGLRAIVGASGDDTAAGTDAGSATVFAFTGAWTREAALAATGGAAGDGLGVAVALSDDGSRALVGAYLDDVGTRSDAGSAHVFLRSGTTWAPEAALVASDGATDDLLGWAVGLDGAGTRAIAGAYWDDVAGVLDTGSARVFSRTGTAWAEAATLVAADGAIDDWLGSGVALSGDGALALAGRSQDDVGGRPDVGGALVFRLAPADPPGTACTSGASCVSGACVDGFCCDGACGGGAIDCQGCASALTGVADGTCAPLAATVAATVTCRASADACDAAEVCAPTSTSCPGDTLRPPSTICRAAVGACDVEETCTGASAACPTDARVAPGTECRASTGGCDTAEACDGTSSACPADVRVAPGVVCRSQSGECDVEERCDGTSAACPIDAFRTTGFVCRPSIGFCDVEDVCSGSSGACTDAFLPAGTECLASSGEVCDAPDVCAGTSADCIETFLSGVVCRDAAGTCDAEEICVGDAPECPPDAVVTGGTPCRTSTASCDPEEICDGVATVCPLDVTTCGSDAGASDGGAPDAAVPPVAASGACHAGNGRAAAPAGLWLVLALVVMRRPRRSRPGPRSSR